MYYEKKALQNDLRYLVSLEYTVYILVIHEKKRRIYQFDTDQQQAS